MVYVANLFNAFAQTYAYSTPDLEDIVDPEYQIDLSGKVIIVTGGSSGCGYQTTREFLLRGAKVYIASRSQKTAQDAINQLSLEIQEFNKDINVKVNLNYIHLDLSDLNSIVDSVNQFLALESRLDILVNNAGVMYTAPGSLTRQGINLEFGTNVLGPFVYTILLRDILISTASQESNSKPRIIFTTSSLHHLAPKNLIPYDKSGEISLPKKGPIIYDITKAGDLLLAKYFNRAFQGDGIISLAVHPGFYSTNLQNTMNPFIWSCVRGVCSPVEHGSINFVRAALSQDLKGGDYISPWSETGNYRAEADDPQIQDRLVSALYKMASSFIHF